MRDESRHRSWFRTRDGRAYLAGLGAIVALKIALLAALYLAIIAPQPRVPPTPEAQRTHLLGPPPTAAKSPPDGR
ncbi:MAG: hypothetical protein U1F22_10570 [Lysobacterales bacterium]